MVIAETRSNRYQAIVDRIEGYYLSEWIYIQENQLKVTNDGYRVPFVGDICESIFRELWDEELLSLIEDAINRHDDDLYGFATREDFYRAVWTKRVHDPALQPQIEITEISSRVLEYLHDRQMFFIDYNMVPRNVPIKEVW